MRHYPYAVLLFFFIIFSTYSGALAETDQTGQESTRSTEQTINLYPLPVSGTLHLAFKNTPAGEPEILLYDIIGNLVSDIRPERQFSGEYTINLGDRKPGYYFIKVKAGSETFSRRITVTQ